VGQNDGIYKERNETIKAWKKVCGGPKEYFEAPGDGYDGGTETTLE
jgi:hypothetical protein